MGIESRILDQVEGVSYCKVYENPSDLVDKYGRRPHSVHVVCENGDPRAIAEVIYKAKAGGVTTHGTSESESFTDAAGKPVDIKFDRPLIVYAWIRILITGKNYEETFPASGLEQMRASVHSFCKEEFAIGDDLINQKLFTPIYSVSGIKTVSIETAITSTPDETPLYSSENIEVDPFKALQFAGNESRILIIDTTQ
ncbi:MAG: hypothetical protein GY771_02160 [bacterium]|nr:hypothetical protein [bacterium]